MKSADVSRNSYFVYSNTPGFMTQNNIRLETLERKECHLMADLIISALDSCFEHIEHLLWDSKILIVLFILYRKAHSALCLTY